MLTIEQSISKLKIALVRKRPFYGVILMKLNEFKESNSTDIISTDGSTIYYNRNYMESLNETERNFYLIHQLYHCIFMHPSRMAGKDIKIANMAADILVNYYIDMESNEFKKAGILISIPKNSYRISSQEDKKTLDKLSFEQLYEFLYKKLNQNNKSTKDQQIKSSQEISFCGNNINLNQINIDLIIPHNIEKTASNMRRIVEESIITNKMYGSKLIGEIEGSLFRRITELIGRRVPWYRYLKRYLTNILEDDTSFDTPDKNHIYRELILPGAYEDENYLEDIILLIDTSGSISNEDLSNFLYHAYKICEEFEVSGKVIFFDSIVQDVFDIDKNNINKLPIHGGEGTDINVVLKYVRDEKLAYSCIVILTDGYFSKPNIFLKNVIWCLSEDGKDEVIKDYKGSTIIRV